MTELQQAVREFLDILDTVEESDSGRPFRPVYISSCRVLKTTRIQELLEVMAKNC